MNKEKIGGLFVLFGATGDLAQRELLTALHQLYQRGHLSTNFAVLGAADTEMNDDKFQSFVREAVENGKNFESLDREFLERCRYTTLNIYDKENFSKLKARMLEIKEEFQIPSEFVYFYSVAPQLYGKTTVHLDETGITDLRGSHRVMIEKPLGNNLTTSKEAHELLNEVFEENKIYYIDHYLGMDFAQNIIATRYYNPFIEAILNKDYVKNIQISLPETKTIGSRGEFYEKTGALLDMFQSHILQVLTLIGMELPESLSAEEIHANKLKFLKSIPEFSKKEVEKQVVRGQYGPDSQGKYRSYQQEDAVARDSQTETYVALELYIDSPRWEGVPIYVRTGKSLAEGFNAVDVILKAPENVDIKVPNRLSFSIRPEKGASFVFHQKLPKNNYKTMSTFVGPDHDTIDTFYSASPYENLIADALLENSTYFMTFEQIEEQWRITDSVVKAWEELPEPGFPNYRANTLGPSEAEELLAKNGDEWIHRDIRYV